MKFIKKHKKGLIILAVIIALVVGIVIWFKSITSKAMDVLNDMMSETAVAEKRDIVSVVSATGKITSVKSKDLTSTVTGAKIKEVLVNVGDSVKEGDILVVLDSENIEKNLSNAESSLATAKQSSNLSINSAQRMYNEQATSNNSTITNANEKITDLEKQISDEKESKKFYEKLYDSAVETREKAQAMYNAQYGPISEAERKVAEAKANLKALENISANDLPYSGNLAEDISSGEGALAAAIALNAEANQNATELTNLAAAVEAAKAAESAQLAQYNASDAKITQLEDALETAKKTYDDTVRQTDSALAARQDSLTSAKLQSQNSTQSIETQIDTLNDQLEACVITAPFDGIVTVLPAEVGNLNAGTSLATIEDTSSYEITSEIDEYDIGKVKVGQRVVIKTNGTGDEELNGTVVSVAPRATQSPMGAASSAVTYTVKVSVDTKNDMIKLDMTAKLSIVLEESNDTLTVPFDAIYTDDDGKEYVKVIDGKDANGLTTTHDVYVTTGIKNDYYVEILKGLTGGEEVTVEREASSIFDFSIFMEDSGAMGGM